MSEINVYVQRVTEITVLPAGLSPSSERATRIKIADEGGGEFVEVEQIHSSFVSGLTRIDPDEWPHIRDAIDKMIANCMTETKP